MHKWNNTFFEKWAYGLSIRIPFVPEWIRLAFSYFSGKPKYCKIHFSNPSDINNLPEHIKLNVRQEAEEYYLDLNEWSGRTIGLIVYPEERVYLKVQKYLDSYLNNSKTVIEYY